MTITHSLVFRVLKSKYFPFGMFLDAKLGSNPFFLWRSILAGRPTLLAGLFWGVGNGRSIWVVENAWLPMPAVVKEGMNQAMRVCDLIDIDRQWWNEPMVDNIFAPSSVVVIERMLLPNLLSPDQVFWKATPTGHFTVKSTYALAQKQSGSLDFGSSLKAGMVKGVWRKLWGLHVPRKVKHFLWHTCQEVLPTCYNLHKRHITKEALYVFYS